MSMYLDAIDAKTNRARIRLSQLKLEIDEYISSPEVRERISVEFFDEEKRSNITLGSTDDPHEFVEWSVTIGEIVHNLRSALDHLVWQLVGDNGGQPSRANMFPIVSLENRDNWESVSKNNLKGVSDAMKERIRRIQPFAVLGAPYDVTALSKLHHLSNVDKHRRSLQLTRSAAGLKGDRNSDDDCDPYQKLKNDPDIKGKVEIVLQFHPRLPDDPQAKPDQEVGGLGVLDTLEETITAVETTIAVLTGRKSYSRIS